MYPFPQVVCHAAFRDAAIGMSLENYRSVVLLQIMHNDIEPFRYQACSYCYSTQFYTSRGFHKSRHNSFGESRLFDLRSTKVQEE